MNGGAWCPKASIQFDVKEFLEVDLRRNHLITWTGTQGRFGNGQGVEYTEQFTIEFWRDVIDKWVMYKNGAGDKVRQISIRRVLIEDHKTLTVIL